MIWNVAEFLKKNTQSKIDSHWLGLVLSRRAAEVVETDIEPVIDIAVQFVIFITNLLRCQTFFYCLCLSCRAILIRSTYIQNVVVPQPTEPAQIGHNSNFYILKMLHRRYCWYMPQILT